MTDKWGYFFDRLREYKLDNPDDPTSDEDLEAGFQWGVDYFRTLLEEVDR